jgi:hypothetical protein
VFPHIVSIQELLGDLHFYNCFEMVE